MKVVVIGCTHAGTAAVINAAKLHKDAEITVYERNDNISFLSCGIALYIHGVVKDPKGLFYSSPEQLAALGVKTFMRHEVLSVDVRNKKLRVRDLSAGREFEDSYDKLIVTSGSWPIQPPIENIGLGNIHICKNYEHAMNIAQKAEGARSVAIIGAGYIGTELVEAFEARGKAVTLIDQAKHILPSYMDFDMIDVIEDSYRAKGITLALGQMVKKFTDDGHGNVAGIVASDGEFKADMAVLCVGFKPRTELFADQLDRLPNGAIKVDEYMRTSDPDVMAAGDCCSVYNNASERTEYIPLATNAVRMGTLAARNLKEPVTPHMGTQGTSGIKIYNWNLAGTGLNECAAARLGIDYGVSVLSDNYRPEFMPTTRPLYLKMVYDKATRRVLGAQIRSEEDLTQSINAMSICIQNRMTVEQLAFTDFFFQPYFNKPWNFLNAVALKVL